MHGIVDTPMCSSPCRSDEHAVQPYEDLFPAELQVVAVVFVADDVEAGLEQVHQQSDELLAIRGLKQVHQTPLLGVDMLQMGHYGEHLQQLLLHPIERRWRKVEVEEEHGPLLRAKTKTNQL